MPFLHTKSTTGPETRWKACNAMGPSCAGRRWNETGREWYHPAPSTGATIKELPTYFTPQTRRMTAKACLVIDPHHRSTDGTPSLFASNPGGPRQFRDG